MRGRRFSEDLRWTVIRAAHQGLGLATTSALTGISERQVWRIRACYGWTGDVRMVHDQWGAETRGRNVVLTMEHRTVRELSATQYSCSLIACVMVQFVESYINRNSSTYLDELQKELHTHFDLQVSISAICQYLKGIGYTYKKVGTEYYSNLY